MTKKPTKSRLTKKARTSRAPLQSRAKPGMKPAKPPARDPLDAFIDAAARTLGLVVEPSWRPAVKLNLALIYRQAALVTDFPLPDDTEPAPVFTA
jgi:Protein of unknown function (DUF4089)